MTRSVGWQHRRYARLRTFLDAASIVAAALILLAGMWAGMALLFALAPR
jgi:hypothetical protein